MHCNLGLISAFSGILFNRISLKCAESSPPPPQNRRKSYPKTTRNRNEGKSVRGGGKTQNLSGTHSTSSEAEVEDNKSKLVPMLSPFRDSSDEETRVDKVFFTFVFKDYN